MKLQIVMSSHPSRYSVGNSFRHCWRICWCATTRNECQNLVHCQLCLGVIPFNLHRPHKSKANFKCVSFRLDICGLGICRHPNPILCVHQHLRHSSSKCKEDVEHQRMPSGVNRLQYKESSDSNSDSLQKNTYYCTQFFYD